MQHVATARVAQSTNYTPRVSRHARVGTSLRGNLRTRRVTVKSKNVGPDGSPDDSSPNATWDEESAATGLSAQLRTTNTLRASLSANLFDIPAELVDNDVVYTSQVHEARGRKDYCNLMKEWKPLVKRNLQSFTYDCERAFCPEPGVLLVRWRAEWDGAFNADAAMVTFIEENFPEYDEAELAKLKNDVEGTDRVYSGNREYDVRGITTIRVNQTGKVTMHTDRIVEKGEYLGDGGGSVDASLTSGDDNDGMRESKSNQNKLKQQQQESDEKDEIAARDEFATTVFYNALKPPGVSVLKWFFDVLLELEWQYFRKQVGEDTGVIGSKEEFVNTIGTLLITVVVLPSAIITYAVLTSLTSPGGLLGTQGDEYDALIQQADAHDRLEMVKKGGSGLMSNGQQAPALDADLLRSLYGAKIGL